MKALFLTIMIGLAATLLSAQNGTLKYYLSSNYDTSLVQKIDTLDAVVLIVEWESEKVEWKVAKAIVKSSYDYSLYYTPDVTINTGMITDSKYRISSYPRQEIEFWITLKNIRYNGEPAWAMLNRENILDYKIKLK